MKKFAQALGLLLVGCGSPASVEERVASSLVLIIVDTLRADHVAAYGGPVATPALDRLAAEGVVVERAFTPTPTTGPAHASLFSGWYPWRHGVLDNAVVFAPEQATLAERLQGEGLETAAFVSSYILHPRFGFDRGFDRYEFVATEGLVWRDAEHAEFYARAESTTEQALDWLEPVLERGTRFFLWVHYFDPHFPYAPPEGFRLPPSHRVDLRGKRVPEGVGGRAALAALVRAYQGEVRYVDAEIGRLIEVVRQHDPMGQTAIVVTSDHGEGLGDHGKLAHGTNLFEELVRIPLILRAPGLPAGVRVSGPVQLEDLYPTLLSILGVAAGDDLDGVDHLAALKGVPGAPARKQAWGRRRDYDAVAPIFFARDLERKWIGRLGGPGRRFELRDDPEESGGRFSGAAPPELRRSVGDARDTARPRATDVEARRALEALGYLDDGERP